ncbi:MAG: flagellar basal body rod protein FlgB [Defluviitaleaceae bacterium]|nr:flagellar basal body rod protein FlgB [Defluviitaleaceae bacterium]
MLVQAMHNQNRALGAAMHATGARLDVIMNNIANNDTPYFVAGAVDFEAALGQAIDNWRATGRLDLSGVRPNLRSQDPGFAFRMDGNNVDMESEMVRLYTSTVRYEAMVNSVLNNSRRLNMAISGR